MSKVAEMNAEVTRMEGQTEAELAKVLANRRQYEYMNAKLEAFKAIGENSNLKIFGNQKDDMMSQMAAFNLFNQGSDQSALRSLMKKNNWEKIQDYFNIDRNE